MRNLAYLPELLPGPIFSTGFSDFNLNFIFARNHTQAAPVVSISRGWITNIDWRRLLPEKTSVPNGAVYSFCGGQAELLAKMVGSRFRAPHAQARHDQNLERAKR